MLLVILVGVCYILTCTTKLCMSRLGMWHLASGGAPGMVSMAGRPCVLLLCDGLAWQEKEGGVPGHIAGPLLSLPASKNQVLSHSIGLQRNPQTPQPACKLHCSLLFLSSPWDCSPQPAIFLHASTHANCIFTKLEETRMFFMVWVQHASKAALWLASDEDQDVDWGLL